jgi:hypothetical protein
MRAVRIGGAALAALLLVPLAALAASAVLDRPATVATTSDTLPAGKAAAWRELADLAGYEEWNPVFREASGEAVEGERIRIRLVLPGSDPLELEPEVTVSRPERKLWWRDRLVVPGLRDWEYEVILTPLDEGTVLATQQLRAEGLLAPLQDGAELREALTLIADALRERLAG